MRTCSYLTISRHNVFYFRWPIPRPLHPNGKRSEVKLSLGTREPRTALQLARILSYLGYRLLDDFSGGDVRYDEIRALLKGHFTRLLEKRKASISNSGRLSTTERAVLDMDRSGVLFRVTEGQVSSTLALILVAPAITRGASY